MAVSAQRRLIRKYGRGLYDVVPLRIPGVRQLATSQWPPACCPKCGNPRLTLRDREAHCAGVTAGCGLTFYHVREH